MMKRYFPEGLVARFGGEEFCILYGNDEKGFERRLEAMREELANTTWEPYDKAFSITISIGMVHANASIDTLVQRADRSLYQAKTSGRNQCVKDNQIDVATL